MAKVLIGNFKGPKGDQGVKGDPGTAASIQVGTTQTVQPEENAEVTNSGTTSAAVLNFKIPRGKDGMTDLTAEYTDASEYTCQPTVNAPVVLKEIDGKTEQGENPSPDNPQVIKGVGGMGYFDGELLQGYWNSSSPGEYVKADNFVCNANKISCKNGDVISIKTENYSNGASGIIFYDANGIYLSWFKGLSTNAPENARYFNFRIEKIGITPQTAGHITVTINGEYQTGVEVMGAQLFDASKLPSKTQGGATVTNNGDGSFTVSGSGNLSDFFINYYNLTHEETLKLFKQGNITLACDTNSYPNFIFQIKTNDDTNSGSTLLSVNPGETANITKEMLDNTLSFARFYIYGKTGNQIKSGTIKPMLYQDGDGTWQPYRNTSIQFPLTSPLYEGDKICYVKPGESYVDAEGDTVVADRILYGVYRENATVVFDGSEDEAWNKNPGGLNQNDRFRIPSISSAISDGDSTKQKSNMLVPQTWAAADNSFYISNANYLYIRILGTTEVDALKTWLQSNPLTVVYKLAQPYFEPFVDQSIFYTLRTDDTLSYVYSNDPMKPALTVEVAKNSTGGYLLESYAQAQKNAISEANSQSRLSAIEQQLVNQATTPTE